MSGKASFAKILQRSKYATYDPSISQVYSAAAANRARGDFGFKRPIQGPPNVRVRSQDNELGVVEYINADGDVKVLQRIEEMRIPFDNKESTSAAEYSSYVDKSSIEDSILGQFGRPEVELMDKQEFDNYLQSVKSLRGEFKKFLNNQALDVAKKQAELKGENPDNVKTPPVDLYNSAQNDPYVHQQFLKQYHAKVLTEKDSKHLTPNPHFNGGLRYSTPSPIESSKLSPSIPGRILPNSSNNSRFRREKKPIALAGLVASTDMSNLTGLSATDFASEYGQQSRDSNAGQAKFRVMNRANVSRVPKVVNTVSDRPLDGAVIDIELLESSAIEKLQNKSEAIGSPEYVSTFEKDIPSGRNRPVSMFKTINSPLFNRKKENQGTELKISELLKQHQF